MRNAIEQLIEYYERRIESAMDIIIETTDRGQYHRVSGKRVAYQGFVRELKAVLANAENDSVRVPTNDPEEGQAK